MDRHSATNIYNNNRKAECIATSSYLSDWLQLANVQVVELFPELVHPLGVHLHVRDLQHVVLGRPRRIEVRVAVVGEVGVRSDPEVVLAAEEQQT